MALTPARASSALAVSPAGPAPTTRTSASLVRMADLLVTSSTDSTANRARWPGGHGPGGDRLSHRLVIEEKYSATLRMVKSEQKYFLDLRDSSLSPSWALRDQRFAVPSRVPRGR